MGTNEKQFLRKLGEEDNGLLLSSILLVFPFQQNVLLTQLSN